MKVQIENQLINFNTPSQNYEFWDIIKKAQESKTIKEFKNKTKDVYDDFLIGYGANHIWVKQIDFGTKKPYEHRLLLITEK